MTALAPFEQSVDYSTPTKRRRNSATKRRSRGSSAYDGSPARGSIAALASTTNDASDSYQTLDRIERYDAEKAADEILTQVTAAIRDENLDRARSITQNVAPSTKIILGPLRWPALRDWGFASQSEKGKSDEGKCILYDCSGGRNAGFTFNASGRIDVAVYVSARFV